MNQLVIKNVKYPESHAKILADFVTSGCVSLYFLNKYQQQIKITGSEKNARDIAKMSSNGI